MEAKFRELTICEKIEKLYEWALNNPDQPDHVFDFIELNWDEWAELCNEMNWSLDENQSSAFLKYKIPVRIK